MASTDTKTPTSQLLAGMTTTGPKDLTHEGIGPSIVVALEEELDVALRSSRRLRRAGLAAQADAGLRYAAALVRELCATTGRWPDGALEEARA